MTDVTREEAIDTLKRLKTTHMSDFGWDLTGIEALDFAISDMKRVEDLYGYVDDAIGAEKRMMGSIFDLASEEYHKGIIYAFERMKMKLME